jgi:hypothetical protein
MNEDAKRILDELYALRLSVTDLHTLHARTDERMNATFVAIHDRQRRASDNHAKLDSKLDELEGRMVAEVSKADQRLDAVERKLLVWGTVAAFALAALELAIKVVL